MQPSEEKCRRKAKAMYYDKDLSCLEEKNGHRFENRDLLSQALNHSSFVNEHRKLKLSSPK